MGIIFAGMVHFCTGALNKCLYLRGPRHARTTREEQIHGFYQKIIWPPMALRIGLPGSSALQNDGHIVPVILQCRTPQETNPKGQWGPNYFLIKSNVLFSSLVVLLYLGPLTVAGSDQPGHGQYLDRC